MLSTLRSALIKVWRLSALRQALTLTAAFLVVVAGATIFALFEARDAIDGRVEDRLEFRFRVVSGSISEGTFLPEDSRFSSLETVIFIPDQKQNQRHYGREGTFSANDLVPPAGRLRNVPREPWLFLGGEVEGGWLIVGQNIGELKIFDEVLTETFVGIGWMTLTVLLSLGVFFGWRSQRRLSDVTTVLGRVGAGDLTARVSPKRDRDDLDHLGLQVDETIARVGAALEQARGFSANIAHDLKTPLTRLRIRLETALLADGDREEQIGAALEQADKSIAIFDAFLRLAKLESGALENRFESVDLAVLATNIAETYGAVIEDSGRELETNIAPTTIDGDQVLLGQLLSNLIQNAIRHTPEGTKLTIVVRPGVFGLLDNGPGIPQGEQARVTDPLYRLDQSRNTEGAGLGLSLAKAISTRHGGTLLLSDPLDGGSGLFARMIWDA